VLRNLSIRGKLVLINLLSNGAAALAACALFLQYGIMTAWHLAAVVSVSSVLAFLLVWKLQRIISGPIERLAETVQTILEEKNFTIFAARGGNDELGRLIDGFNEMLAEIQRRDAQLKAHRNSLEQDVQQRTEELRALNAQLLAARDRAEAASRAKTAFLANMSHEIRTPITAIVGCADLMLEPSLGPAERQEHLQIIRRNAQHLAELINDILDISKIEAGKMSIERTVCDLPRLTGEVVSLMRWRAISKGLEFRLLFDGPIPRHIHTGPLRLKQVLMNILGNAIKFTERGSVTMRVSCRPEGNGSTITFAVADTGIGMSREQMEHLFQPFSQADGSTTRRFGGTGLGLVICQRLVKLLGGQITVESQPGVGSTFTVSIDGGPVDATQMVENPSEAFANPAAAQPAEEPPGLQGRILLVEDGVDNQRLISAQLKAAGATVEIAANGRQAVEMALSRRYDLIVMDMQMPELDGYGATAQLRQQGLQLPIIALTAHAMSDDRDKCIRAGCTDYLAKPVDRQNLIRTLGRYMPASGAPPVPQEAAAAGGTAAILRSKYADDEQMRDLLAKFVGGLPDRVSRIMDSLHRGELEDLRRLLHQLKGAGGGYGFAPITAAAAQAESAIKTGQAIDAITAQVNELVELIRTVEGYDPAKEAAARP